VKGSIYLQLTLQAVPCSLPQKGPLLQLRAKTAFEAKGPPMMMFA